MTHKYAKTYNTQGDLISDEIDRVQVTVLNLIIDSYLACFLVKGVRYAVNNLNSCTFQANMYPR